MRCMRGQAVSTCEFSWIGQVSFPTTTRVVVLVLLSVLFFEEDSHMGVEDAIINLFQTLLRFQLLLYVDATHK